MQKKRKIEETENCWGFSIWCRESERSHNTQRSQRKWSVKWRIEKWVWLGNRAQLRPSTTTCAHERESRRVETPSRSRQATHPQHSISLQTTFPLCCCASLLHKDVPEDFTAKIPPPPCAILMRIHSLWRKSFVHCRRIFFLYYNITLFFLFNNKLYIRWSLLCGSFLNIAGGNLCNDVVVQMKLTHCMHLITNNAPRLCTVALIQYKAGLKWPLNY